MKKYDLLRWSRKVLVVVLAMAMVFGVAPVMPGSGLMKVHASEGPMTERDWRYGNDYIPGDLVNYEGHVWELKTKFEDGDEFISPDKSDKWAYRGPKPLPEEKMPDAKIGYELEILYGLFGNHEYLINGISEHANGRGEILDLSNWIGSNITIEKAAILGESKKSPPQPLDLRRPNAPGVTVKHADKGEKNGSLTIDNKVTAPIEYSTDPYGKWTEAGVLIPNLPAGTYYVRTKATASAFKSSYGTHEIKEDTAPPPSANAQKLTVNVNSGSATSPITKPTGITGNTATITAGESVTITAGSQSGHTFSQWSFNPALPSANITSGTINSATITFTMPTAATGITATANWNNTSTLYTLTVSNSYASTKHSISGGSTSTSTTGSYPAGQVVTIYAGDHTSGTSFSGWTVVSGGTTTNNINSPNSRTTTITMPSNNLEVRANWGNSGTAYLTIIGGGSGATVSQQRSAGEIVNISAGSRTDFYFTGWTVNTGNVTLNNPNAVNTSFTMPSSGSNVTLTANWSSEIQNNSRPNDRNDDRTPSSSDDGNTPIGETPPAAPITTPPAAPPTRSLVLNEWSPELGGVKPYVMVQVDAETKIGAVSPRVFTDFIGGNVDFVDGTAVLRGANKNSGASVEVTMKANATAATVNGQSHDIATFSGSAAPGLVSVHVSATNNFYVPLRFMTEAFGYTIGWNAASATATIVTGTDSTAAGPVPAGF